MNQLRNMVDQEIKDKTKQLCADEGISVAQYTMWIEAHKSADFVKQTIANMNQLKDDLFEKRQITHIPLAEDLPKEFTKEKYIVVYRKIWATIRHDIWKECQRFKKEDRVANISEERFNKIFEEVHKNFE